MTKAEAVAKLDELKKQMQEEAQSFWWDNDFDEIIEFLQSLPDIIHCKECANYNPNIKFCMHWDCTMYENAYCDQGERRDGEQ